VPIYHAIKLLHDDFCCRTFPIVDLDLLFHALADATRRRLIDELAERSGQTLFELHVRMVQWHGASLSRQALSGHLAVLEKAGLVRCEWQWRSKFHFLQTEPLRRAFALWLAPYVKNQKKKGKAPNANRVDQRTR
jgi:DNA-binding transcriptional ArsR family regulator